MLDSKKRPQGTFDSDLVLKGNYALGAGAATVFGLVAGGGAPIVLNVGSGLFKGMCVIDLSALIVGANEEYRLTVQGGDDAAFTNNAPLATVILGDATNIVGLSADTTPGRFKIYFDNEVNGTYYPFIRLQIVTVVGTANATFSAYVVPIQ